MTTKEKLQGLITQANGTTGAGDATLTAAINTLIEGFGKGGGDFDIQYIAATKTLRISTTEEIMSYDGDTLYIRTSRELNLEDLTVTPTKTEQILTKSEGYDAIGTVKVKPIPAEYIVPAGSQTKTENGTYNVTELAEMVVAVPAPTYDTPNITVSAGGLITASANGKSNTQQLTAQAGTTITPSESVQTAVASGKYTTGDVKVGAISTTYVGSGVTKQAAKTVTPTKSEQTAVASGVYTTGAVKVGAIPSQYIVPSGSETKTSNGTYDVTNLAELVVNVSGGGGGLPSGISAFDYGQITVSTAFTTTRQTFSHKLGVTPDLMIVWRPANIATTYSMLAAIRGNQFGWRSSAYNNHMAYHGNSTTSVTWTNSNSTTYGISNMTATNFQLASSSTSYYWREGTYKYLAIKF